VDKCPECGSALIIKGENGEFVCGRCGLVIGEEPYDMMPEWRAFTPEEVACKTRVGTPLSILHADKGLTTIIDRVAIDASGHKVALSTKMHMFSLGKLQSWARYSSVERNLLQALGELNRITGKLHIPGALQEEAAGFYRKLLAFPFQELLQWKEMPQREEEYMDCHQPRSYEYLPRKVYLRKAFYE
jgi:transcription initiation factor TFIIB